MIRIMQSRPWKVLEYIQKSIMVLASLTILTLVVVQVTLRYVFVRPLMGVEELATMTGFWLYFMGASWGTADRSHIKADLVNAFVKDPRKRLWIQTAVALLSLGLCIFMTYWGWQYVLWGISRWQRSSTLMIPMIYSQVSIFICAVLMVFYFGVEFVDNLLKATGRTPLETDNESDPAPAPCPGSCRKHNQSTSETEDRPC
jgi:TRAP-type transport system small permease protein